MKTVSRRPVRQARSASSLALVVFSLLLLSLAPRAVFGQG